MTARQVKFSKTAGEDVINHYGAVRLRIFGSGSLKMQLYSLDQVKMFTLLPVTVVSKTNIEPTRLANFTQQKARLEIRTTELNEVFQISKVIVFVRPTAKSYPGAA